MKVRKMKIADELISYSDLSVGHSGTIYKAANFKNIGETQPTKHVYWKGVRYHPRSLTIDRPYSYRLREAVSLGEAVIKTGLPKKIWLYEISEKLKHKNKKIGVYNKKIGLDLFEGGK